MSLFNVSPIQFLELALVNHFFGGVGKVWYLCVLNLDLTWLGEDLHLR